MHFLENIEISKILAITISLIVAIVGHEVMHGFIAYKYGDDTAKNQNRLSLNPIKHVDLFGTILVPGFLALTTNFIFGWAKPVPIHIPTIIRNGGYFGAIAVSLAGVFYNFFLAICSAMLLQSLTLSQGDFLSLLLFYMVIVNVILAIFNLYPLPSLDGFQALGFALAWLGFTRLSQKFFEFSRYGLIILVLIIATPIFDYFFIPMKYAINLLLPSYFY